MIDKPISQDTNPETRKLGLTALAALVISSMIGAGFFNLPQNMTSGAGLVAIVLAWIITGVGMSFLANSFRILANEKPEVTAGVFAYARHAFGRFVGFEMAWGYWLSVIFGNVAYVVLVMQSLGYCLPVFGDRSNWPSIVGGSVLIWAMHFLVLRGVRQASYVNVVGTVAKIVLIILMVIIAAIAWRWDRFTFDVLGQSQGLGSLLSQVRGTMLVTLWVFIGIEGACAISGCARSQKLVGRATLVGLMTCLSLYALITILPFGVLSQAELSALPNPSTAYLLDHIVGGWGGVLVNLGLLISVLSSWLAWTLLAAEVPFAAAGDGLFPEGLSHENRNHTPAPALWLSSIVMQLAMFVVLFAQDAWIFLISVAGMMVLPPYLSSTLYLCKLAFAPDFKTEGISSRNGAGITAVLGTIYALWLLYGAGLAYLLMSVAFYALGIPLFWRARRGLNRDEAVFTNAEIVFAILVSLIGVVAIWSFAGGHIHL
ncbi:MAG: basic amino acid/polyamine antiporter [Hyphomicrobiales bacterium]